MSPGNILPFQRKPEGPDDGPSSSASCAGTTSNCGVQGTPDGFLHLEVVALAAEHGGVQALEDGGLTLDLARTAAPDGPSWPRSAGFLDRGRLPGS